MIAVTTTIVRSAPVLLSDSLTSSPHDELAATFSPAIESQVTVMLETEEHILPDNAGPIHDAHRVEVPLLTPKVDNYDERSDVGSSLSLSTYTLSQTSGKTFTKYFDHKTVKTETVINNLQSPEVTLFGKNVSPIGQTPIYHKTLPQVTKSLERSYKHLTSSPLDNIFFSRLTSKYKRAISSKDPHVTHADVTLDENTTVSLKTISVAHVTPTFGEPKPIADGIDNAGRTTFVSYFSSSARKSTPISNDTNQPSSNNMGNTEHGTETPAHSHQPNADHRTGEAGTVEGDHGIFQSAEDLTTASTFVSRKKYTPPEAHVGKESPDYDSPLNLLNLRQKLKLLEAFVSKKCLAMCELDNMPLISSKECLKEVLPNLPSFSDNMAAGRPTVTPKESIIAVLNVGFIVFKRYEELLNSIQRHGCSRYPGHHCPFTCVGDYSHFSHFEKKVCLIHITKLRLNGVMNYLTGVMKTASFSTQRSVISPDDSIWSMPYPELQILTGLTKAIEDFINIL